MTEKGRVGKDVLKGSAGSLFGVAMMAAVVRTVLRLRNHRRLFVDDIFFLLACLFLTAATIILYEASPQIYFKHSDWLLLRPEVLHKRLVRYQRMFFSYTPLSWAAIFAVKFCFICFFRVLVDRLRFMIIYWKIVVAVTAVCFCFCASETAIKCPHFDVEAFKCGVGKSLGNALGVTAVAICLDIITDLMIVAIPISLLWRAKMKTKQKLGLGVFLCLSVFMILAAMVRSSNLYVTVVVFGVEHKVFDVTWKLFWQQFEACIAVLMASLTGFRSIFMADSSTSGGEKKVKPGLCNRKHTTSSDPSSLEDHSYDKREGGLLPPTPSAAVTDLRTFVRGGGSEPHQPATTTTSTLGSDVYLHDKVWDGWPAPRNHHNVHIV